MENNYIFDRDAGERVFLLSDGKKLASIKELYRYLDYMDNTIFCHHVNDTKNDFANWIRDVFEEKQLAEEISMLRTKKEIKSKLSGWMSNIMRENHNLRNAHKSAVNMGGGKKITFRKSVHEAADDEESEDGSASDTYAREDLKDLERPVHMLAGIIDFLLGFIVGALAMILFIKMI